MENIDINYRKYTKYKRKYLQLKNSRLFEKIDFSQKSLIGVGDFSHGDNNIWEFRLELLKYIMSKSNQKIVIYIEDIEEHTDNIMHDKDLIIENEYGVAKGKFPYGPIERYAYRSWDSPIYLKIIKYIRKNKSRITIIGVDSSEQARDKLLAKNILKKLDNKSINFFWGANAHIDARKITETYELKWVPEEKYRAGYYLKKKLKDKYCIILSAGYEGTIRFSSVCNNLDCDERTFPIVPIFENIKHEQYKKYKTNNEFDIYKQGEFGYDIIEYTDAKFPNEYFDINTNMWDYIIFFSKINKLELIETKN